MAKMVFALKNVPEDEIHTIKALLDSAQLDYYETSAGRWQISVAGLWVRDNADVVRARALIAEDQQQRYLTYQPQRPAFWPSLWSHLQQNPVEFGFTLLALMFVLGLSLGPFLWWF